ncbi:MAG: 1,4-dihydroxy-6-naphthoate synthase [Planctomycetota bacterium]
MKLAISTCPNDTFAFHAILENKIDRDGLNLEIELLDIQQLNDGLFAGDFDVAKASFHAAARLADSTWVLPSGSALGFGVGPLLLAAQPDTSPLDSTGQPTRSLCPGVHTTAAMLFQMFYGQALSDGLTEVEHVLFSEIMPQLKRHEADFGVCIHEGRFTWQQEGLSLVEDLGTRWENETNCPLPLGGILVRRSMEATKIAKLQKLIQLSIQYARDHRLETTTTMRKHAQEFDDEVMFQHVDLYVNDWTLELGDVGIKALAELSHRAKTCGLVSSQTGPIEVWNQGLIV